MTAEPTAPPSRATGYVSGASSSYGWWSETEHEHVPDLLWPWSAEVYDRMRTDPQVAAMLRAVMLPVLRTPWRIERNGARDEVVRLVSDDLGLPVVGEGERAMVRTRGRFSWSEHLRLALTMLPFGFSMFEQEARVENGYAHLRRLGFRPQRTLAEPPKVARDGGLVSIQQYGAAGDKGKVPPIPVGRLVAYVHDREGGNWLGRSILRPAYGPWLLKDRLLRIDTIKNDRNGVGIPVYTSPPNPVDAAKDQAAGEDLMKKMRAGDTSGMAKAHGSEVELLSVEGTLPDTLASIRYHDEAIAKTVLGHFMNLGQQTGTGSYALGVTFVEVFNQSLQTVALQIADVANAHVIEDLVDWNWGESEPAPRLVFDEIGSRARETALGIKALIDAGLIRPDRALEEWMRQTLGMPPKETPLEATT